MTAKPYKVHAYVNVSPPATELAENLVSAATALPPGPPGETERPGDPPCLLRRVCPECGSVADEDPPTICPACMAAIPAG